MRIYAGLNFIQTDLNQGIMNSNMTCGFIQVGDRASYSEFTTNIELWPSSAKGELTAIILALLTVPDRSDVIIQTDSENTLNRFYDLQKLNFVLTLKNFLNLNITEFFGIFYVKL